jgi:dihydrofolate synthase / folylpolyglutamate synthase
MRFNSLQKWLAWQETLNPKEIDLGLDRVEQVLEKLKLSPQFICPVITVAGTNGKGSTVAFLESILKAANYSVGCYTSPHLFSYNERIRLDGENVDDEILCNAFDVIDQARGDIPLTYFEFGTLAALVVFAKSKVDVTVLEVGLGGRLDAVNVIDADVAVVTSIDIDHTDWLGEDIETIATEKAGVFRADKPAIYGSLKMPRSISTVASDKGAKLLAAGKDYLYQGVGGNCWQLITNNQRFSDLPVPVLKGAHQLQNAAAAIMALQQLNSQLSINEKSIHQGLHNVSLQGRYQLVAQSPQVIVDVAHNAQAAKVLAELLADDHIEGRTYALIAMLADKAVSEVVENMTSQVDEWFSAGLDVARGLDADLMAKAVNENRTDAKLTSCKDVVSACQSALQKMSKKDRLIVFGSFYTVTQASEYIGELNIG